MCSRIVAAVALLFLLPGLAFADQGGRRLEFGVNTGWTDFDDEIRFEDDVNLSASILAEVLPFFAMGLELSRVGAEDRLQDTIQDVVVASLRGRIEPWRDGRFSGGGLLGVNFVAFENGPGLDSVSEGFELGGTARWNVDSDWRVRFDLILRLQAVNRPVVDATGAPTGAEDEIGFVWSQVYRVGLARGF